MFDVRELSQPALVKEFLGTPATMDTKFTDHNLSISGHYLYQASYNAGMRVINVKAPGIPREVGYFDTTPAAAKGPKHTGAWSA